MSIEQTNVVDFIGVDRTSGEVVLTLTDAIDWDDQEAHLRLLKAKLESYLAFVEAGEILESYPDARGRPVRIDVIFRVQPIPAAIQLLDRAKEVGGDIGVSVDWKVGVGG